MLLYQRIFIISGIILTVISLFMTNYVLRTINDEISSLNHDIRTIERDINLLWQEKGALEQHVGISITLLLLLETKSDTMEKHKHDAFEFIRRFTDRYDLTMDADQKGHVATLNRFINDNGQKVIDKINKLYEKKLDADEEVMNLTLRSNLIQSWALFLYSLGLILVLSHTVVSGKS